MHSYLFSLLVCILLLKTEEMRMHRNPGFCNKLTEMSSVKQFFKRLSGSPEKDYSSHSSMVKSPPPGRVTARDDPNHEVWKPQSSKGDQSIEVRIPFYNCGFTVCHKCGEKNIWRFEEKAGVEANGDTYGTESFRCQTKGCGWKTSFLFNDGKIDCKYYETTGWPKGVHYFPASFMLMWADKHELGTSIKHQFFLKKLTGNMLIEMQAEGSLEEKLEINKKEAEKICKALNKPMTAVMERKTSTKAKSKSNSKSRSKSKK